MIAMTTPMIKRRMIALSGGMDSTTLLHRAVAQLDVEIKAYNESQGDTDSDIATSHRQGDNVVWDSKPYIIIVAFDYGSKHAKHELDSAERVAAHYKVPKMLVDLRAVMASGFKSNLLRSGDEIPEGHYQEENMRQTVVPGRNLLMLSVLAGLAESHGYDEVWIGAHSGDHFIYPDCRPEFIGAAASAIWLSSNEKVQVQAPFLRENKTTILGYGIPQGVPYHMTRTCYKNQRIACGKCGSCQERLEAFAAHGIEDPIEYESRELIPKQDESGGSPIPQYIIPSEDVLRASADMADQSGMACILVGSAALKEGFTQEEIDSAESWNELVNWIMIRRQMI